MLRHARWLEREEARKAKGTHYDEYELPTLEETHNIDIIQSRANMHLLAPLEPVDYEILEYLARCPDEEWAEFEAYTQEEEIVLRAREDPDVFMEYCFRDKDGADWKQQDFHRDMQALIPTAEEAKLLAQGEMIMAYWADGTPARDGDGIHMKKSLLTEIVIPREHAKCLSAASVIYLSNGKRIRAGDMVQGKPYQILSWSESSGYVEATARCWQDQDQEVYKIATRTGRTTTLSVDHPVWTSLGWKLTHDLEVKDRIGLTCAGFFGQEGEPGKAWLVGFLIGNGCFARKLGIDFSSEKPLVLNRVYSVCKENNWSVSCKEGSWHVIQSLDAVSYMRDLGIATKKSAQKVVPEQVFGWSKEATIQFLQGYFDADETYNRNCLTGSGKMTVKYASSFLELIRGMLSLLGKLGIMGYVEQVSTVPTAYVLSIKGKHAAALAKIFDGFTEKTADLKICAAIASPQTGILDTVPIELVCRLTEAEKMTFHSGYSSSKKLLLNDCSTEKVLDYAKDTSNLALFNNASLCWDQIVSIKPLGVQRTYSVEVDDTHVHVTDDFITHNTTQISIGRTIWEIGRNNRLRCKVVAATPAVSKDIIFDIAQNIELNLRIQRVFPDLKPDYKSGWTKTELFVQRGYDAGKDATVSAKSVLGSGAGGRADWLLFDDVVDFRNAVGNPKLRPLVKKAIKSTFLPLMPPDGRAIYSATPWSDDDATNEFRTSPGWSVYWRPAITERKNRLGLTTKEVLWRSKYNLTVLNIRRLQMGDTEFSRQYLLLSISDDSKTFPEGNLVPSFDYTRSQMGEHVPRDWARVGGMDLASSFRKSTGAYTVLFTFAIEPDTGRMIPIEMYRHQMNFTAAVEAVIDRAQAHRWELLMVENNGYQQAMISALEKEREKLGYGLQIEGFRTGNNKADPVLGLPGLAVVFSNGGIAIPYKDVEEHDEECECAVCIWVAELRGHPGARLSDTVMATWFAQRAALKIGTNFSDNYKVTVSELITPQNNYEEAREFADGGMLLEYGVSEGRREYAIEKEMWRGAND